MRACLVVIVVATAGCAGQYPTTDTPQEAMARGDGPVKSIGDPPGAGDSGVVSGALAIDGTFGPGEPLAFAPVELYRDGAVVSKATCDGHGRFMFVGVKQSGAYEVRLADDRFVGGTRFWLRSGGHISGLRVAVQRAAANR